MAMKDYNGFLGNKNRPQEMKINFKRDKKFVMKTFLKISEG